MSDAQPARHESAVIDIRDLRKAFAGAEVLRGVDLRIGRGEVVSVLGRSGGGKSTLLRCMNLLEVPDSGTVVVDGTAVFHDGEPIRGRSLRELRQELGMVFQSFHLFPHLTAVENVAVPLMKVRQAARDEAVDVALRLLEKVGMAAKAKELPPRLSGGQQQRVAIARALALRPKALLFDEPTSALDPESTIEVLKVMKDLSAEGMTMVVVTHELAFAQNVSSRLILMDSGAVIEDAPPAEVRASANPRTRSFFGTFEELE